MAGAAMKPWLESVAPHPDVIGEDFSEDIFALDLGPLADGHASVPAVYRDPEHFFRAALQSCSPICALGTQPCSYADQDRIDVLQPRPTCAWRLQS